MVACWELPTTLLLALIAVNLEPLIRCSDGRWRSAARQFPSGGIADEDMEELGIGRLVEFFRSGAIVTDRGRAYLQNSNLRGEFAQAPARLATREAHYSMQ
jgi:hypothetical protein